MDRLELKRGFRRLNQNIVINTIDLLSKALVYFVPVYAMIYSIIGLITAFTK